MPKVIRTERGVTSAAEAAQAARPSEEFFQSALNGRDWSGSLKSLRDFVQGPNKFATPWTITGGRFWTSAGVRIWLE